MAALRRHDDAMTGNAHRDSSRATTLLIVDDHRDFRRQARALLESEGLCVAGEAGDGVSAVDEAATLAPDIVLLDIGLPDIDGFEVARRLAALDSPPKVVLISSRDRVTYGTRLDTSRTAGFVRKDDLSAEAIAALVPIVRCTRPAPPDRDAA